MQVDTQVIRNTQLLKAMPLPSEMTVAWAPDRPRLRVVRFEYNAERPGNQLGGDWPYGVFTAHDRFTNQMLALYVNVDIMSRNAFGQLLSSALGRDVGGAICAACFNDEARVQLVSYSPHDHWRPGGLRDRLQALGGSPRTMTQVQAQGCGDSLAVMRGYITATLTGGDRASRLSVLGMNERAFDQNWGHLL
jgi:hypothetical protein